MDAPETGHWMWLDRVEGDRAVLRMESGAELDLPMALLPPEAVEGSWMKLSLIVDPERTAQEAGQVSALLSELDAEDDGGDLVL